LAHEHDWATVEMIFESTSFYLLPFLPDRARAVMNDRAAELCNCTLVDVVATDGGASVVTTRFAMGEGTASHIDVFAIPVEHSSAIRRRGDHLFFTERPFEKDTICALGGVVEVRTHAPGFAFWVSFDAHVGHMTGIFRDDDPEPELLCGVSFAMQSFCVRLASLEALEVQERVAAGRAVKADVEGQAVLPPAPPLVAAGSRLLLAAARDAMEDAMGTDLVSLDGASGGLAVPMGLRIRDQLGDISTAGGYHPPHPLKVRAFDACD